jgi:hypothetical protein
MAQRYHGLFFITIACISVMGGSAQLENLRIRTLDREYSNQNDTSTSFENRVFGIVEKCPLCELFVLPHEYYVVLVVKFPLPL